MLSLLAIGDRFHPEKEIVCEGVPKYKELIEKGVGAFLIDPKTVDKGKVIFE